MDNLNKNNQNKDNQPENDSENKGGGGGFGFYWIYLLIAVLLIGLAFFPRDFAEDTRWVEVREMLSEGDIEEFVVVNQEKVEVFISEEALEKDRYEDIRERPFYSTGEGPHYTFYIGDVQNFEENVERITAEHELAEVPVIYDYRENWFSDILIWIIFIGAMIALWIFLMRRLSGGGGPGGQIFNIGKSKAQVFDKDSDVNVSFKDVAGLEEAKEEVMEVVDFLKHPAKYAQLGGKIPKGILLVGPPGTGKTLIAKAVAGEASVPFFTISGSDFVEMFVGVGASRVRDLFKQAKEKAPCIVFIDEIDAIGRARGKSNMQGGNDERENTLNQLLSEMDGFGTNSGVIMLAATNRPDVLDTALLRPGRFDRQISIDKPDLHAREEILKVHTKDMKIGDDVDIKEVAAQTPGFAGAELANICNEAALVAARKNKKSIEMIDFQDAIDRVIGGLEKKNKVISSEEKEIVAYHEAGHALAGWFLEYASPLLKVSIVPRGVAALGYAQYLPKEQFLYTKEQLYDTICMTLGGRIAEEIIFGRISTGAQNDLERVTKMVHQMITLYGMNEKVGPVSYNNENNEWGLTKPYSDRTAELIDKEVRRYLEEAYQDTKKLMEKRVEKLKEVAAELLEKEVIFKSDLERILGKRPYDSTAINEKTLEEKGQIERQKERDLEPDQEESKKVDGENHPENDGHQKDQSSGSSDPKENGNPHKGQNDEEVEQPGKGAGQ